jgi:hypothetical protein
MVRSVLGSNSDVRIEINRAFGRTAKSRDYNLDPDIHEVFSKPNKIRMAPRKRKSALGSETRCLGAIRSGAAGKSSIASASDRNRFQVVLFPYRLIKNTYRRGVRPG